MSSKSAIRILATAVMVVAMTAGWNLTAGGTPIAASPMRPRKTRASPAAIRPSSQSVRAKKKEIRIFGLVKSPAIGINFDTGNAYLCGHDPYAWLERVVARLVHLHAKDISLQQSGAERG